MSRCRFCGSVLDRTLVDLGTMPLANSYPRSLEDAAIEPSYPLHARVCDSCLLVQVDDVVDASAIFSDYPYFSSMSDTWSTHAMQFAARATRDLQLGPTSRVIEVASNDGYLLRHFRDLKVPVLGVEPAANVAAAAEALGIPTLVEFFDTTCARRIIRHTGGADLLVANNVLAHVPSLNDFVSAIATVLKETGVVSIEFPHLLSLIENVQFDTIYHEHFSYFSLQSAEKVLEAHGLSVFDAEQLPTHGGSLRLWVGHATQRRAIADRVAQIHFLERAANLDNVIGYSGFSAKVASCRQDLCTFLRSAKSRGASVAAYAAAAKGNTLLNYCGVTVKDVICVADRNPHKQGRYLPGSHIPIVPPGQIDILRPDYILVLAWNLRDEICERLAHAREWGAHFVFPVPRVAIS